MISIYIYFFYRREILWNHITYYKVEWMSVGHQHTQSPFSEIQSGLWGLVHISHQKVDRILVSTFMERWQSETITFHMPYREMTITFDDVATIIGIPMVGRAISPLLWVIQWILLWGHLEWPGELQGISWSRYEVHSLYYNDSVLTSLMSLMLTRRPNTVYS